MSFHEYSAAYHPPIPVCELLLGGAGEEPSVGPLIAIMDTGADATVIPMDLLRRVDARRVGWGQARSVWGDSRRVELFLVSLRIDSLNFRALQVLGDEEGDEIIVGRFVLNRLRIILDGPAAMSEIQA